MVITWVILRLPKRSEVPISCSYSVTIGEGDSPRNIVAANGTSAAAIIATVIFNLIYHGLCWYTGCDVF